MNKGITEILDGQTINYLYGNVQFKQDSVFMFCDTAILKDKLIEAKGRVAIVQEDSVKIFADYLLYNGYIGLATFLSNVVLESGDQKLFTDTLNYDTRSKIGRYKGKSILSNASTNLTSINGTYNASNKIAFFRDSVFVIDSLFTLQTDSLAYDANTQKAIFLGPTLIFRDSSEVYCEGGYYLIEEEYANFIGNAQYVNGAKKAQADSIIYNGSNKSILLLGNSQYRENLTYASADTITYFEKTEDAELRGNAFYSSENTEAKGQLILYNGKTESILTGGRTLVKEENQEIIADRLRYDGKSDEGHAGGEVIWRDTSANTTLFSEDVYYKKESQYVKAYGNRPMLIIEIDEDSMFIVSDTLLSKQEIRKIPKEDQLIEKDSSIIPETNDSLSFPLIDNRSDTSKILVANRNVQIYKFDFQAVCDSLYFNEEDSVFHLIGNPIMWAENSQFTGDSIFVYMKNGAVNKMKIVQNGFIISTEEEIFYNQIKGKDIIAFFKDGKIDKVQVLSNAETIYYILDDSSAYIGVNKLICSEIWMNFEGDQVNKIRNLENTEGETYPMRGTDHDALRLSGFRWMNLVRPERGNIFAARFLLDNTE